MISLTHNKMLKSTVFTFIQTPCFSHFLKVLLINYSLLFSFMGCSARREVYLGSKLYEPIRAGSK